MIGLGRMGANMVRRLIKMVTNASSSTRTQSGEATRRRRRGRDELTGGLFLETDRSQKRLDMVPAAITDKVVDELATHLQPEDTIIDGGNSYFRDDRRRSAHLRKSGIHYLDVGTSGGVWGLERGYCMMIGGDKEAVDRMDPIFKALAPGRGSVDRTPGRDKLGGTPKEGYLHCGASGAGHFVKMVHNGIEYGLMAAFGEGFDILASANASLKKGQADAETAPIGDDYVYDINLADVAEVWRRGSVVSSWLLDLAATAFADNPTLSNFSGRVSDSGEGRWTIMAAIDEAVEVDVLSAALFARFRSRKDHTWRKKSAPPCASNSADTSSGRPAAEIP